MRIVILNQYCENRGDEAAGTALIQNLLRIDNISRIDIIYNSAYRLDIDNPKVYHRNKDLMLSNIGIKGIIRYLLLRKTLLKKYCYANRTIENMIDTICQADYIFVTPCGASIGIYKDWAFLLRLVFTILEGKSPIFHLNTIGKSGNVFFDLIAKWVLNNSKIYVRDRKSEKYIKSLNLNVVRGVDTAFSLDPISYLGKRDTIGLIITQLGWHPEFQNRDMDDEIIKNVIPGIVLFCKKSNLKIEIIPHLNNKSEIDFIKKIKSQMITLGVDARRIKIRLDVHTESQYDKAIANKKMIIGMRYHSIVLSAKNFVPFVSLAYEYKMKEVSNYTKCSKYCLDLHEKVLSTEVFSTAMEVLTDHDKIVTLLKEEREDMLFLSKLPLRELDVK